MTKLLNLLKKPLVLHGSLAFVLWLCTSASASVIDAPHNETNNVKCSDCHAYSLWWQYSPANNNNTIPYAQITNAVCDKCHHNQPGYPEKIAHAYTSMGETHQPFTGDWTTNCVDCHNPHLQSQLDWLATEPAISSSLFLATGTIQSGTLSLNTTDNTTTFSYLGADAQAQWLDPADWPAKTGDPSRGLILAVIVDSPTGTYYSTYEVNQSTEGTRIAMGTPSGTGTIEVQGTIPASYEGKQFGLIYGQLIRQHIDPPNTPEADPREVKFFDATIPPNTTRVGGFAEIVNTTAPVGVCQVCHRLTTAWLQDGSASNHHADEPCTNCHDASLGFKPTYLPHPWLSGTDTSCVHCHTLGDIVKDTHKDKCGDCHAPTPAVNAIIAATGKWPSTPHADGTCYDCHVGIKDNFATHPNANDHSTQVLANATCVNACHFHKNKDIINEIHVGEPPTTSCVKCHSLTETSPGVFTGTGWLISKATAGTGDCVKCHGSNVGTLHPNSMDHSAQVTTGTDFCAVTCHEVDENHDAVNSNWVHSGKCNICHNTGANYALKSVAATNGPGSCTHCHENEFSRHSIAKFQSYDHTSYGAVASDAACATCHTADMITGVHGTPPVGGTSGCENCHNKTDGSLVTRLANLTMLINGVPTLIAGKHTWHTVPGTNPANTCSTCHQFPGLHPTHADMNVNILPVTECINCHTGDYIEVVHNNDCLACHTSLIVNNIYTLQPGVEQSGGDCVTCHASYNAVHPEARIAVSFHGHKNAESHAGQVDGKDPAVTRSCQPCHLLNPYDPRPTTDVHPNTCDTCHIQTYPDVNYGKLVGSASTKATGKPPTGFTYCTDCHIDAKYQNETLH